MNLNRSVLVPAFARGGRLICVAAVAVMLLACGQPSPERLMNSAREHLAKGDRSAAVIELKNLLQQAPNNGEARLLLGQAQLEGEDYASAEKELSRALELKQPHEKVVPPYALALVAQGKYQVVVTEIEKYKLFDPAAVATTQTALGDAYTRLGSSARAQTAYAAALAAVPAYSRAKLGQAMLIAAEGRLDEALSRTDEVIAADPNLAEARAFRADVLLARGDRNGARKTLEEAISANGRFLPARLSLIGLLTDEREFDAAAKLLVSTRELAPRDLRVNYLEASLAFRKGELEKARQQVQQVLKHLPEHLPSLVLAGAIDMQAKQYAAAENYLRKVVARAPNHLGARQLLVRAYLQMGQPAKAKETLQPIVDRGMSDDARIQLLAGETYLAAGDVKAATGFFQAASKSKDLPQVAARTRLGQIALATGKNEEGFKELEAVSELDTEGYRADLMLIAGHLQRKQFDEAMESVKALEKKQPKNPVTFQMYGVVNLAKGDLQAARESFEKALEIQPNYMPSAYNLAELDIRAKKPEEARKRYEAMIAKEPNNEQLYLALAELQARTGAGPSDIRSTLQRAIKANAQAPAARLALINFELGAGDAKAALAASQDALAAFPSDPRVLLATGVAQENAGEINQAIGTYNKLAGLQPQAVQPLYRLAALHVRQKDTDKAIESLRRAQKIAPRERDLVPQFVQVYVAAQRYDEAIKEARDLQKREPRFAGGFSLEGDVYLVRRAFVEAERLYREALKLDPKANGIAIKLHGALIGAGKTADAATWAKKWITENPKDAAMRSYLGEAELNANNLKAAAAHYQAVIGLEPNNAPALNNLAWISGELGDARALEYAERAVRLAPANAEFIDTYGMLLVKKGEVDKALPFLERVREMAPARNDLRLNYAKALMKAGKKEAARKELEALAGAKADFKGKEELAALLKGL